MHTFRCDFRNYRSGRTSTSRRNYFFLHRKTGTQGIRNSRMSADLEVIVSTQMGKGYYASGFMQMNTAREICRGGDALSDIDLLKNISWVQTIPNAKMNTTNCGKMTSSGLSLLSSTERRKGRCSHPIILFLTVE